MRVEPSCWKHGILFLLALLLLPIGCSRDTGAIVSAPEQDPAVTVRTQLLEPRTVVETSVLPADLLAQRRALLAAEVAGSVETVKVELGDRVSGGQLLATIDERSLEQAVVEAEAFLRQAWLQLERAENLFERKAITRANLLDATTAHDVAQARLASAKLMLEKARVRAPWSGRIASRFIEPGSYVGPGSPLFDLVDDRTVIARALAPEADVPYLRRGSEVAIGIDALGRTVRGRIERLGAALDAATRTLAVEVELDNRAGELVPGMVARMEVTRRRFESALLVPVGALVDLGDRRGVWAVLNGRATLIPVGIEARIGEEVVVSGIDAGTRIIVEGKHKVGPGALVAEV